MWCLRGDVPCSLNNVCCSSAAESNRAPVRCLPLAEPPRLPGHGKNGGMENISRNRWKGHTYSRVKMKLMEICNPTALPANNAPSHRFHFERYSSLRTSGRDRQRKKEGEEEDDDAHEYKEERECRKETNSIHYHQSGYLTFMCHFCTQYTSIIYDF